MTFFRFFICFALATLAGHITPAIAATATVIAYGTAPHQAGQLTVPGGKGPFPVVVLIHGGCWMATVGGPELMTAMTADLLQDSVAVWNIDYRRLGDAGGGYPGTFQDAGQAVDVLRRMAKQFPLDLSHIVLVGHSAGGHLALWAAGRRHLPKTSPLAKPNPLPVQGVVSLAGIGDLAGFRKSGPDICGGPSTIDQLTGLSQRASANPYADTSPLSLLPLHVPEIIISGARDRIVPPPFGEAFASAARLAGDTVNEVTISETDHMQLIDPRAPAWTTIRPLILALLR